MKPRIYSVLFTIILLIASGCKTRNEIGKEKADLRAVSESKAQVETFSDVATVQRIVQLDNSNEALFGEVNRMVISPNGDILIGDFSVTHGVYRFSNTGIFKGKISRRGQGPGEYEMLQSFSVMKNGNLVLAGTRKLLVLTPEGQLVTEVKTADMIFSEVVCVEEKIFVRLFLDASPEKNSRDILVYDKNLNMINSFGPYDTRRNKYLYGQWQGMAVAGNELFIIPLYNLGIAGYSPEGEKIYDHILPNQNEGLNSVWEAPGEVESGKIRYNLHRFHGICSNGHQLLLFEAHRKTNTQATVIFSPETGQLTRLQGYNFNNRDVKKGNLGFLQIVDGGNGLFVGVIDDPQYFNQIKNNFAMTSSLKFSASDNLLLAFFRLKERFGG